MPSGRTRQSVCKRVALVGSNASVFSSPNLASESNWQIVKKQINDATGSEQTFSCHLPTPRAIKRKANASGSLALERMQKKIASGGK
jgi:hypothetical protein